MSTTGQLRGDESGVCTTDSLDSKLFDALIHDAPWLNHNPHTDTSTYGAD